MAEAALATPAPSAPSAAPSTPSAPASPPAAAPAPSAAPPSPAAASPRPETPPAPAAPAAGGLDDDDLAVRPNVVDARLYKTERARLTGQVAELQRKLAAQAQLEQQFNETRRNLETASARAAHFDALSRVIRQDRELAARIEEMIGELPDDARPGAVTAAMPPEALKGFEALNKLAARAEQQERAATQRQAQLELQETTKQLREMFRPVLEKRHMPFDAFTPLIESYVLRRLNAMGEAADFDEVPYLVAEFVKPVLQWHLDELARVSSGKREDSRLPAAADSTPPVHAAPPTHANDSTTNQIAEAFLRSRGWS